MKNNNLQNTIPNKLKEFMIKADLTQFDVMLKLGVRSTDRISKWEKGKKDPAGKNKAKRKQKVEPGKNDEMPL